LLPAQIEPPGEATHWTGRAMAADRHLTAFGTADLGGSTWAR
jgi:hypothetical protein